MNNFENALTGKDQQLAKELTERADGGMKVSLRGMGRLLNLSKETIRISVVKPSANKKPSKLAQTLISKGFDLPSFSDGIPDEAIEPIARFYADKGNSHAKQILKSFADIGARVVLRMAKGLPPTVAEVKKEVTHDEAFAQMFEALQTAMPMMEKMKKLNQAISADGQFPGLKSLIDEATADGPKFLLSGDVFTSAQFLDETNVNGCTKSRGFRSKFGEKLAERYMLVTKQKPEKRFVDGRELFVYDEVYRTVAVDALDAYLPVYQANKQAQLDKFNRSYRQSK